MRVSLCSLRLSSKLAALSVCACIAMSLVLSAGAQEAGSSAGVRRMVASPGQHAISLVPLTDQEVAAQALIQDEKTPKTSANFREFGRVQAGQVVEPKRLTLRFAAAATLTRIESTPDFKVEQGGTCLEGNTYPANATCTLMVRFTPQGPGRRTAKLTISNSVDATPLFVGLGGFGSAPAISFTPSVITTVPGTYVAGVGLLSGAGNLAVDNGDALYAADTGNQAIRYLGSNGTWQSLFFDESVTDPEGIVVDNFDDVYLSQDNSSAAQLSILQPNEISYFYLSTPTAELCGDGNSCAFGVTFLSDPGALARDPNGNIFLAIPDYDLAYEILLGTFFDVESYTQLSAPASGNPAGPVPIAVDKNDALYGYQNYTYPYNYCFISSLPYDKAAQGLFGYETVVAGSRGCGFSGDGGQASSALIGTKVGQMVFDQAGNFYFTDTSNHRVRRIDAATGIINTIAGNGTAGYSGDNGPATSATLNTPTGVAVDSQGQVYIISSSATTGSAQVVRKVGTVGALNFGSVAVGSPTAAQFVTLANTGNSELDFTHVGFSAGGPDFTMDVNTTSCNFTVPLASGRSCKIGFIFNPTATGTRSAVLSITDDTVTGLNTIQLSGTGATTATLTPATLSFASTNVGSTSAAQTVTLANTGKAVLTISSIAFSGAAAYTDTTTCGTSVAVGGSCTIAVSFKPVAAGAQNGTLTVNDNALGSHQTVSLTGTGVAVAKPALSPTSLTFASTTVGSSSAAQTITLSNTGGAALGVTSVGLTGTNAADYSLTQNCGTSVAAGGSCKINVTFKPTAAGTRTASVSIVASTGTLSAAVSGTATAAAKKPALSPSAINFGSQAVSIPSAVRTLTMTNATSATLTVSAWTWSGANVSDFSQTHSCGKTMAAGASCSVELIFRPTAAGTRSASLTITTSAGAMVATLTGFGVRGDGQPHQSPSPVGFVPGVGLE